MKTERNTVVSRKGHGIIGRTLQKVGKKSVGELTEDEKAELNRKIREVQNRYLNEGNN